MFLNQFLTRVIPPAEAAASSLQSKEDIQVTTELDKNRCFMSYWARVFKLIAMSKLGMCVNVFNKPVNLISLPHPVRSERLCIYLSLWLVVPVHSERSRASPCGGVQTTARKQRQTERGRQRKREKGYNSNILPPPPTIIYSFGWP